jgi:hypothetical protein
MTSDKAAMTSDKAAMTPDKAAMTSDEAAMASDEVAMTSEEERDEHIRKVFSIPWSQRFKELGPMTAEQLGE